MLEILSSEKLPIISNLAQRSGEYEVRAGHVS